MTDEGVSREIRRRLLRRRSVVAGAVATLTGIVCLCLAGQVDSASLPSSDSPSGEAATPRPAREVALERLFGALRAAPDPAAAQALEAHIRALWLGAASPAARLLIVQGRDSVRAGDLTDALATLDDALVLAPDSIEAWFARAEAQAAAGDRAGALHDLQAVLAREPRHFAALALLSRLAGDVGDAAGALAAWDRLLDLDPQTPGGQERRALLRRQAAGEGI